MSLRLRVISHRQHPPTQVHEHVFDERGGTIGRTTGNDFVLPDPERFVSGQHAALACCGDGTYYITDTSTNGVFLNEAREPLGHGHWARLNPGDYLTLGEYRLEVQITSSLAPSPSAGSRSPGASLLEGAEGPELRGLADSDGDELLGPNRAGSLLAELDTPELDPHRSVEEGSRADPGRPWEEPFQALGARPEPEHGESDVPASPSSQGESAPLLPEDWDQPPESETPQEGRPVPGSSPSPSPGEEETPRGPSIASPEAVRPEEQAESRFPPPGSTGEGSRAGDESAAPHPAPDSSEEAQRLLQAFLSGAGLSHRTIPPEQAAALMEQVGSVLRALVDGTMAVLQSRSSIKGEFRLAQTTIRPVENNPLKFSVGVDDALEHLLRPREGGGYLPPLQATEEAYEDIKAHQLAVMAGMQAALKAVLERFDPAHLEERRFESPSVLERLLPRKRKAKHWERFTEHYQEVAREAEEDFQRLFGEAFARTYEEQLRKLRDPSPGQG